MVDKHYQVYKSVIEKVISDQDQLPSLPSITLKIRQAIGSPTIDNQKIAQLIRLDPSLSALLLKHATSPLYRRAVPPKTIEAVLSMMGLPAIGNLVMAHSVKSLFVLRNPMLKKLFTISWRRMLCKAAMSQFLAMKLGFKPAEEAMTASILTDIGTLAILSAFDEKNTPDKKTYLQLCKTYSKSVGTIVLNKWGLDKYLIEIIQTCGKWSVTGSNELAMVDVINLAIYSTVMHQSPRNDLPPITTLDSYKKLPPSLNAISATGELVIIRQNIDKIREIIGLI